LALLYSCASFPGSIHTSGKLLLQKEKIFFASIVQMLYLSCLLIKCLNEKVILLIIANFQNGREIPFMPQIPLLMDQNLDLATDLN
jgi:hypothetical protein